MFSILKDKLKKAIDSISGKLKEKEEEKELGAVEEPVEEKIEEVKPAAEFKPTEEFKPEEELKTEEVAEPEIIERVERETIEPEEIEEVKETEKTEKIEKIEKAAEPEKKTFFKRIFAKVVKKVTEHKLDEADIRPVLGELEMDLVEADVAVEVAEKIKGDLLKELAGREIKRGKEQDAVVGALKKSLMEILAVPEINLEDIIKKAKSENRPAVLLFFGMNGVGKSLNLSKVANFLKNEGHMPILAAADTYRAAGDIQLEMYGEKIGVPVIKYQKGGDSCAVIFDTISAAKARGYDIVLGDTAGRMHTAKNLMDELAKIIRVNKPDIKILVLDSLTGSDVIQQFEFFNKAVGVDAIIFSKNDINEKGGNILSVCYLFKRPILFLGTGQGLDDLVLYDPKKFVGLLIGV